MREYDLSLERAICLVISFVTVKSMMKSTLEAAVLLLLVVLVAKAKVYFFQNFTLMSVALFVGIQFSKPKDRCIL